MDEYIIQKLEWIDPDEWMNMRGKLSLQK